MIDPFAITDHSRDRHGLEELWIFCLCVAGKRASMISRMVEDFLSGCGHVGGPFDRVRAMVGEGSLGANLRRARLGKYALLERALPMCVAPGAPDILTAGPDELESIPGVGPKTSRFFLLHGRAGCEVAVIDTHVSKWLRAMGHDVPKAPPTGRRYAALEAAVLAHARGSGMTLPEFDLAIWSHYASGGATPLPAAGPR